MTIIITAITTDENGKDAIVMCADNESHFSPLDDRSIFCNINTERKIHPLLLQEGWALLGTSGGGTPSTYITDYIEAHDITTFCKLKQTIMEAIKTIEFKLLISVLSEFGVYTDDNQPSQAPQFLKCLLRESPEMYKDIQKRIEVVHSQFQFELTLAGFEPDNMGKTRAIIYDICDEPRNLLSIEVPNQVGWCCAGLAEAVSTFHMNAYLQGGDPRHTTIPEMLYCVYRAKKAAECTKGIGKGTHILVLRQGKEPRKLDEIDLKILEEHYSRELNIGKELKNILSGDF